MLQPKPATPSYWKALIVATIFGLPIMFVVRAVLPIAPIALYAGTAIAVVVAAYFINAGMKQGLMHDWAGGSTLGMMESDKANPNEPSIHLNRVTRR